MLPIDSTTRSSAGTADPSEVSRDREKALAPYLAELVANDSPAGDGSTVPSSLFVADQHLTLDPWERGVLEKLGSGVDAKGRPWPALVAQGLAFGAKCLSEARRFETDEEVSADEKARLVDELITVAAAGVAVFAELQSNIDQLIRDGRMGDAKRLGTFRNKVGKSVATMRNLLGSDAFARAEADSTAMLANPARTATEETSGESEDRKRVPTQFKRDAPPVRMIHRSAVEARKPVWLLLAILIVCAAAWIVMTVTQPHYVAPPELTIEQFRHVEAIRSVEAKRPSVFVKLDESAWSRIVQKDRQNVIREIGHVAEQAGYSGAQVWTTDGKTVGRWLRRTGVRLSDGTSDGS
jgi:hypothetical protein